MDKLAILILEDVESDARLMERALRAGGIEFSAQRVETREDFLAALGKRRPDVILADYNVPHFDGRAALKLALERLPNTPVVIVTGALADNDAVELLRDGAADYILKDRLSRLAPAVRRALDDAQAKAERAVAETKYRTLFELAGDGIVLVDAESAKMVDCNGEFCSLTGRSLEQLKQLAVWDLCPAENREAAQKQFEHVRTTGDVGGERFQLGRPDGGVLPIEFRARVIELGGRRFILAQGRDISARLDAEAKLHAQIDELRRFQRVTVDRELRMQELEERLAAMAVRVKAA